MSEQNQQVSVSVTNDGRLMVIENSWGWITLDREEAMELFEQLQSRLGEMSVKVNQ